MITASVKTTRTKIMGTLCVILAGMIALILFFGGAEAPRAAESISRRAANNEERKEYLSLRGFKTAAEPSLIEDVLLPEEMDEILAEYNESQMDFGFDLSPFLGKTVKKYVYPIEGEEETFATLYVYEEKIIAADIASHIDGWQRPIDGSPNMG